MRLKWYHRIGRWLAERLAPESGEFPRAVCPNCGRRIAQTSRGFYKHQNRDGQPCVEIDRGPRLFPAEEDPRVPQA